MKKIWFTSGASIVLAGCLIFLLFFYRGHQPSPSPNSNGGTQDTSAGNPEEIVSNSCISCHGENLQGGAGPALNKIGAKYTQNDIEDIIKNGKNGMPAGVISNEEAAIVAEWLSQKKWRGNFSTISMALIKRKIKQPNPIKMDQAVL